MRIFDKLFKKKNEVQETHPKNTLMTIKQFDDVWIKIDNEVYEGWVVERSCDNLLIVYTDSNNWLQETTFKIERPFNRTQITEDNRTLILNKDDRICGNSSVNLSSSS